ncbi:RRQRL motif-containing zinc-binding protein [Kutzneria sp. NPDC051319]|uniref:RRQRL motif-containing zinc-binding protein n=1 Tax=Kutzneria sp. NPDC051319 TaxID=3155047 RepID=UPI0034434E07
MANKVRPVLLLPVAWSPYPEFTHGLHDGLPLLPTKWAPPHLLATRRQLNALGKRPGGQDPVALLYGYSETGHCQWFANLYLISRAKPKLPMTPRKWHALNLANLARRECKRCHRARDYVIPPTFGMCFPCVEASENTNLSNENGADPWAA